MKKLFVSVLVVCLLVCNVTCFAQDDFKVVVSNATAQPKDTVQLDIRLENNSGILAMLFDLEYDQSRLQLISATDTRLVEGGMFSQYPTTYPYRLLWNSASFDNFTQDGVLATLQFAVKENAPGGSAFVRLSYEQENVYDVNLDDVVLKVVPGAVEVISDVVPEEPTPEEPMPEEPTPEEPTPEEPMPEEPTPEEPMPEEPTPGTTVVVGGNTGSSGGSSYSGGSGSGKKPQTQPDVNKQLVLTIGQKAARVFGETKENDVAPKLVNSRTMLPARFVAEALGAKVLWNAEEPKKVEILKDNSNILLYIDSDKAYVDGKEVTLDSPAFLENDRTYTPIRFIAEALGAKVEWDEKTQEVIITVQ